MDRLSILLTLMTGAVIAGTVLVTAFTLGYHNLFAVLIAGGLSLVIAWPASYLISRRIKRQDPNWHREATARMTPDPNAPEV
jgi:hypothetical protein